MPRSRESTRSSSETEEEQSETIPTSNETELSKKESQPSKPKTRDQSTLFNAYLTSVINLLNQMHKYEIIDVIDEGAYGIVWKAMNK